MKGSILVRAFRVLFVLSVSVTAAALFIINKPKPERKDFPQPRPIVEVVKAVSGNATMFIDGFGTVRSRKNLNIVARVSGGNRRNKSFI